MKRAILILIAVSAFGMTQASVVYSNITTREGHYVQTTNREFGDAVQLAGTDRALIGLVVLLHSPASVNFTADITARVYAGGGNRVLPGALLWSETRVGATILRGSRMYAFSIPEVVIPDVVTWSIQVENESIFDPRAGYVIYDPPTVGSSDDFAWYRVNGVWTPFDFGGDPIANFGAQFEATSVPEPISLMVFVIGAAAALVRREKPNRR